MKQNTTLLYGLLSLLAIAPAGLASEILYAGVGNSAGSGLPIDGSLLILNQTNASPTLVGQPSALGITGLVFDNLGNLWGSTNSRGGAPPPTLEDINVSTGAKISSVNTTDTSGAALAIGDLAFEPGLNILFGISNSGFLYTINKSTGVGTLVGDTGTGRTGGIGFAPNGTLYMSGVRPAGGDALYTLSPTTGAILTTVSLGTQFFDGLAVRPSDGKIFANLAAVDGIYTINSTTGATTLLGGIGTGKVSDLAFLTTTSSVPEPATWAFMGAGLLALAGIRRRK